MKKNFELGKVAEESIKLLRDTKSQLLTSKDDRVQALASEVPTSFTDNAKPLSIVFAGQYSAGKSSILSKLTGMPQKVGEGVTTAQTSTIPWNGIQVVDTPGIHTQKHPDHDEMTYKAIAEADLIVFVLTNEGFSGNLGPHFKKLINEVGKGHEMMLVVNKMEREALGNSKEVQNIKANDMNKVLAPNFTVDDMYASYISMDMYIEALNADNPQDKHELMVESGWEPFIDNLNKFVKDKGLLGKYTTNLYRLEQVIKDALALYTTDKPEVDASIEVLNRNRRALVQCRQNINERSSQAIRSAGNRINDIGDGIAVSLTAGCDEKEFNTKLERAYTQTESISNQLVSEIENIVGEECTKLTKAFEGIMNSQLAQDLKVTIQNEISKRKLSGNMYNKAQQGAGYAKDLGGWLNKFAQSPNAKAGWQQIFKLGNYSGSKAHKVVLEVGHFFGHKFKPWEAVKVAGKIGKAGKFLGVAGAFVGVAFQIWNDYQESEMENNLRETRNDVREGFRSAANVVEMEFNKQTKTWMVKEIDPQIKEIDDATLELQNLRKVEDGEYKNLLELLERVKNLIRSVQKNMA